MTAANHYTRSSPKTDQKESALNVHAMIALPMLLAVVGTVHSAEIQYRNKGEPVPQNVRDALQVILNDAKIDGTVVITSYRRSAESQATEMIDNFDKTAPELQEKLIKDYANEVEDAYREAALDPSTRQQRISSLAARLTSLIQTAGPSRNYLQHVVIPEINPKNDAVDIGYTSVPETSREALIEAVKRSPQVDQSRFFYYPKQPWERAFHIEFKRN